MKSTTVVSTSVTTKNATSISVTSTTVTSTQPISVTKRKRSQRDLVPKLSSKSAVSDDEDQVTTSTRGPNYYTLSHAKSVGLFYLHTSDCAKELEIIESEIQSEFENSAAIDVEQLKITGIYGHYSTRQNRYYRVRIIREKEDDLYETFFLDHGHTENVEAHDLFQVSESVQQFAPQAICCKLHGFVAEKQKRSESAKSDGKLYILVIATNLK